MKIDKDTKVIGRFVPDENARGLNIYNPYFQQAGVGAVYLLFPNTGLEKLIAGLRNLSLSGAIVANDFEKDPKVALLVDELDPIAKKVGHVGTLINKNGKISGFYPGVYGLYESIKRLTEYTDKKVVLFGSGIVAKSFLTLMDLKNEKPRQLEVYNRTKEKAEKLMDEFKFINKVGSMEEMLINTSGDIFINATRVGSPWNTDGPHGFSEEFVDRFSYIVDVTFVPLRPDLIKTAEKLGKKFSPGHRMFLYQGKYSLEKMLGIKVDENLLSKIMLADFEKNWIKIGKS